MKEIQSFVPSHMNNGAHFTFISNMAERAEKDTAVAEKCVAQVKALREAVKSEDENLQISAKSLITDKIAEADRLRDQLYVGYKKAVAGYTNFPVESWQKRRKCSRNTSRITKSTCRRSWTRRRACSSISFKTWRASLRSK